MTDSPRGIQVSRDDIGHKCGPDRRFGGGVRAIPSNFYVRASTEPLAGGCGVGHQNEKLGTRGGRYHPAR